MQDQKYQNVAEILLSQGVLNTAELERLELEASKQNLTIDNYIRTKNIINEEDFTKARSKLLNIPYKDLRTETIPVEILEQIPQEVALRYKFISFSFNKTDNEINIGIVEPEDLKALEALNFFALEKHLKTRFWLISESSFMNAFKQYRVLAAEVKKALISIEEVRRTGKEIKEGEKIEIEKIIEEAPVSKIVEIILRHAIDGKASDIHIEPSEKELRIRYRIDGVLHASLFLPLRIHPAIISRIKILSNLKIDEQRKPQDGRFHVDFEGKSIDLRVSTLPTANGEKIALRILDKSVGLRALPELGLVGSALETARENLKKPFGIILITGPTGSGKSTTLYALLNILNQEGVNIITLEDPIEYYIAGLNQSQVRPEIGYTFASGLRSILRQDPDVIMVGEIRDNETAELAIHAALTGHIVLSTIHTNDASGVIPRLIDMKIEPFLITASLNLAIAQRLVRKICPYCRREAPISNSIQMLINNTLKEISPSQKLKFKIDYNNYKIFRGKGCKSCHHKGLAGRIAIYEVLSMTKELEEIVLARPTENAIRKESFRQGMLTMKQDGIMKVLEGITTIEEVLRVTEE